MRSVNRKSAVKFLLLEMPVRGDDIRFTFVKMFGEYSRQEILIYIFIVSNPSKDEKYSSINVKKIFSEEKEFEIH